MCPINVTTKVVSYPSSLSESEALDLLSIDSENTIATFGPVIDKNLTGTFEYMLSYSLEADPETKGEQILSIVCQDP